MNFEEFGRKVKKFSRDTVTEVQKMNEIRQMSSGISEQKRQISMLYTQIGQKLYNEYKDNPPEGFSREFQELEEHYAKIEECMDQVRRIKGVRICPNCHTEVSVTERFCSSCGERLPEELHIEEDEDGKTVILGTASEVTEAETAAEAENLSEETAAEAEELSEETAAEAEGASEETAAEAEESSEEAEKAEVEESSEETAAKAEESPEETAAEAEEPSNENDTAAASARSAD